MKIDNLVCPCCNCDDKTDDCIAYCDAYVEFSNKLSIMEEDYNKYCEEGQASRRNYNAKKDRKKNWRDNT